MAYSLNRPLPLIYLFFLLITPKPVAAIAFLKQVPIKPLKPQSFLLKCFMTLYAQANKYMPKTVT